MKTIPWILDTKLNRYLLFTIVSKITIGVVDAFINQGHTIRILNLLIIEMEFFS